MLSELSFILVLVILNGVFAAAEIAVISLRGSRLDALVASGSRRARAVKRLRREPERFLASVQIGITVVGVMASAFGGATMAAHLQTILARVPGLAPHAESVALTIVVALVSYLSLVVGELIPKSLALRYGERYALLIAQPLLALSWLARPVVWFLTASSNVVLRLFDDRTTFTEARLSSEEIQQIVEEATESGSVDPNADRIASRALEFAGLTVGKVMIPRNKVVAMPRTATMDEVRAIVTAKGHTRMPVYDGTLDHVIGYLNVKDLVAHSSTLASGGLDEHVRPSFFVAESMPAVALLEEMKRRRMQFAIVVDELGVTSGIVTLEDLVEESIGDVFSEHAAVPPPNVRAEPDGTFLVRGDARVHDVNRQLAIELPEGHGWSTIAGLCLEIAGQIPLTGQRLRTPNGIELEIVDATERQVHAVRVRRPPPATPDE